VFTGIVEERGVVRSCATGPAGVRLQVECRTVAGDTEPGSSIAVDGVCLTVVERTGDALAFDLAPETLARTTLGALRPSDFVNLERPVTPLTRLGGHLVQGHVDGVAEVIDRGDEPEGGGVVLRIRPPEGSERYVVDKGSIAVDGVSLAVAGVEEGSFDVALVPHTLSATTLGRRGPGDRVNVEVDVVAKYVERLMGRSG
jgi:riboflavin synthase